MNKEIIIKKKSELIACLACNIYELVQLVNIDFHLALSGGNTPLVLFDELANNYAKLINWQKVHVWWGDERCVIPENTESNFRMAKLHLLDRIPIPANNIHRVKGELLANEACKSYQKEILEFVPKQNSIPSFDLIILGMGEDGHTASIFSHEINLFYSNELCVVATHPVTKQKRVSFTGKLINSAKNIIFLISGEKKATIINDIINKIGNYDSLPVSKVNPINGDLKFYIFDV